MSEEEFVPMTFEEMRDRAYADEQLQWAGVEVVRCSECGELLADGEVVRQYPYPPEFPDGFPFCAECAEAHDEEEAARG